MKKIITNCIFGCVTIVIVIIIAILPFIIKEKNDESIVVLGDSIIGNVRDETSVTAIMEKELGVPVFNGAFGGTCMAGKNIELKSSIYEESLNMSMLVDAIVKEDFKVQKGDISGNQYQSSYFKDVLGQLSKVDFDTVETLFIEHGTNDYNAGYPLDNPDNPLDRNTFGGGLRYTIEMIQTRYPGIRIILMTPIYCEFNKEGIYLGDCIERDFGYGSLENYVELELAIGKEYGVEVMNNYEDLGINASNLDDYSDDGLHLNLKGRELLGSTMSNYLENLK